MARKCVLKEWEKESLLQLFVRFLLLLTVGVCWEKKERKRVRMIQEGEKLKKGKKRERREEKRERLTKEEKGQKRIKGKKKRLY